MPHKSAIKRILITGPESSGKTTLARSLAEAQDEPWVPEYAREYLEKYGPDYTLNDL
ncbi:MAG: ATP-binding protein, partial [Saprospiraceae bacterium]|nr:ATP-binding protein [Saprospiraceae bacterium]